MAPGRDGPGAVSLGEQLEKRNVVSVGWSVGCDAQAGTEGLPQPPGGGGGRVSLSRDPRVARLFDSAPISEASVAGGRVRICQEDVCGK